jgi:hypothetical protein
MKYFLLPKTAERGCTKVIGLSVETSSSVSLTHQTFSEVRPHFSNHVRCTCGSQDDPSTLDRINGCPDVRNPMRGIPDFPNDVLRPGATQSVMYMQCLSVSATVAHIVPISH